MCAKRLGRAAAQGVDLVQYPLQHFGDGAFAYPDDELREVAASIECILTTLPGQHPRLPEFGNHAALVVFNNPTPELAETVKAMVKRDIETWEPRAKVTEVEAYYREDTASYIVRIHYQVFGVEAEVWAQMRGAM